MHPSSMMNSELFFKAYSHYFSEKGAAVNVVEIGSQDVNGSIREKCPKEFEYVGLDFVAGKGVDIVLNDPYSLPLVGGSVDILISSSCFEHSEMFWLVFLEALRVLKEDGLMFLTAPSNGMRHCYPVDCWRFYPDAGKALVSWANKNSYQPALLESYTSLQDVTGEVIGQWNDFVAVFVKNKAQAAVHPRRILDSFDGYTNGWKFGVGELLKPYEACEDQRKLAVIGQIIYDQIDTSAILQKPYNVSFEQHKLFIISKILTNELRCL